jgi:hypothetical protein
MKFYTVLFKAVEKAASLNPGVRVFKTETECVGFIEDFCKRKGWSIKSRLGWDEEGTLDDRRVEDSEGMSYYFVIEKQELLLSLEEFRDDRLSALTGK